MFTTEKLEKYFDILIKSMALVTFIFAVSKHFYDESQQIDASQRQAALEKISSYNNTSLLEARLTLAQYWIEYASVLSAMNRSPISENTYRRFLRKTLLSRIEVFEKFLVVSTFFDEVFFCVEGGICDRKLIYEYFCNLSIRYRKAYYPLINDLQNQIRFTDTGKGIVSIANECEA